MKKYRHYQNRISGVIIFLIFFLGISVVIYSDSREQTLEEQRKVSYGAWHAAVYHVGEKENTLKENAMVKTAATLTLAGTAADNSGMILGGIGAADATFLSMGNITLLDGRMPKKKMKSPSKLPVLSIWGFLMNSDSRFLYLCRPQTILPPSYSRILRSPEW